MAKTGKTTGNLKMRSGPGMQFEPPIAYLVPDTQLEIIDEQGDWLHVRAAGKEGYVGRKYVEIKETPSLGHAGSVQPGSKGSGLGRGGSGPVGGSMRDNKKGLDKK